MNRIKKLFLLIHIILWVLLSSLVAFQLGSEGDSNWLALTAGFIFTGAYVFYSHFFVLTGFLHNKKLAAYMIRLTAIIITAPLIYTFFHHDKTDSIDQFFSDYLMALFSIVTIFLGLSWLARVVENLVLNTIRKEQLEKQAAKTELDYLKSQINPHFLFNTLNNIHTLVYKQAAAAPDAVMQLASLMRYMIYESNAPTVALNREMKYLEDYISLQQLRYKQSQVVVMKISGAGENCQIAPLLFIHLLENAYKHSPANLNAGDVKVHVDASNNALQFTVQNPVGKKTLSSFDSPGGIGLSNLRKRLALLYPGHHHLEINNDGDRFTVTLTIHGLQTKPYEREAQLLYN